MPDYFLFFVQILYNVSRKNLLIKTLNILKRICVQNSNRYKFRARTIRKRFAAIVLYGATTGYSLLMNR